MSISRIESLPIVLCLIAGGLGVTAAPAAAQPQPVQRVTLPGMWADVRMQTTVTAGDSILIWVDLEPHDPGLIVAERSVYANRLDAIWALGSNSMLTPAP